jgi:hypothetical protein
VAAELSGGGRVRVSDPVLDDVLNAPADEAREQAIAELLSTHVYWRIDRILGGRFRRTNLAADQRDDVRAEILLRLVHRLDQLARDPRAEPLLNFADYVSVVAFNTFDDFVRRAFPAWTKLRNRVRYALRSDDRFALWEVAGIQFCGPAGSVGAAQATRIPAEEMSLTPGADLRANLAGFFQQAGGPLAFDDVVSRIAATDRSVAEESQPVAGASTVSVGGPGEELENLQFLRELWREICELPLNQRLALLLSARDAAGESVTQFLAITGVATIRQIAATLAIDAGVFGDLWNELPLEDTRIAVILRITRQQVINLRRSARDRLARRLKSTRMKQRNPA